MNHIYVHSNPCQVYDGWYYPPPPPILLWSWLNNCACKKHQPTASESLGQGSGCSMNRQTHDARWRVPPARPRVWLHHEPSDAWSALESTGRSAVFIRSYTFTIIVKSQIELLWYPTPIQGIQHWVEGSNHRNIAYVSRHIFVKHPHSTWKYVSYMWSKFTKVFGQIDTPHHIRNIYKRPPGLIAPLLIDFGICLEIHPKIPQKICYLMKAPGC